MRKRTIKTQLVLSFLAIATLIIGSISLVALSLTNNHFSKYVEERQEDLLNQYVYTIDLLWLNSGETWNSEELAALSEKALENNILPPTINLDELDEECDLFYIPNEKIAKNTSIVMSNGFGFGGHNATLVMRKVK